MKSKLTVTIGIIAYNEGKNIRSLIVSLLKQTEQDFVIDRIIVISDGSTDNTVNEVKRLKNRKIVLIQEIKRIGKAERLNQLFEICSSEILVLFDADVQLKDKKVVLELVKPLLENKKNDYACGNHRALIKKDYFSKVTLFGVKVWEDAIESINGNSIKYRCTGQIRAFSKRFYKKLKFPRNLMLLEDLYSFYFAVKNRYNIVFCPKAYAYYKNASNPIDYIVQLSRFVDTKKQRKKYFTDKLALEYETLSLRIYLKSLVVNIFKTDISISLGYLLLHSVTRVYEKFIYKPKSNWDIVSSTK